VKISTKVRILTSPAAYLRYDNGYSTDDNVSVAKMLGTDRNEIIPTTLATHPGWDTYRAFYAAAIESGLAVALWRLH
jgi:hypothetical protein